MALKKCPTWRDAPIGIRHDGVWHLSDTTCRGAPNGIHDVMDGVDHDVIKLKLFPFSLRDKVRSWFHNLMSVSINR